MHHLLQAQTHSSPTIYYDEHPQLPSEIVEIIIQYVWSNTDPMSNPDRVIFMTACPQLNKIWRSEYARIASTHIHIPQIGYLRYLAEIVRTGKSSIYQRNDSAAKT